MQIDNDRDNECQLVTIMPGKLRKQTEDTDEEDANKLVTISPGKSIK